MASEVYDGIHIFSKTSIVSQPLFYHSVTFEVYIARIFHSRAFSFLDVEKAFDNVGTMDSGIKSSCWPSLQDDTLALWFSSWPSYSSQREWFPIWQNQPHRRVSTGFCPESTTFSNVRQWLTKSSPQTKLEIQVRWLHCPMGWE